MSPCDNTGTLVKMDEEKLTSTNPHKDVDGMFKTRYIQGLMMFTMLFMAALQRVVFTLAVIAMTDWRREFKVLDWDVTTLGRVLSSLFWGHLVMQFFAGPLGQAFSVKKLLLASNVCCAVLTLVTPAVLAYGGWIIVWVPRVIQGLNQGFYVPLSYNLASKWVPVNERGRYVGFFLNGTIIGDVVSLFVSNVIASSSRDWSTVFYVSGVLGLVWSAVWWWVGADSPLTHPTIHPDERLYIQGGLNTSQAKTLSTPWKSILTSGPVWTLIGVIFLNGWGASIVRNHLQSYIFSKNLGFDRKEHGYLMWAPHLSLWVFSFPVCWLGDFLEERKIFSRLAIRRLFTSLCMTGCAVMMMCLSLVDSPIAAITLITLASTLSSFVYCGLDLNHLDLSPHYTGILVGFSNGFKSISSYLAVLCVGVTVLQDSWWEWREVFLLIVTVTLVGNAIFMIWGSADVQPWDSPVNVNSTSTTDQQESNDTRL